MTDSAAPSLTLALTGDVMLGRLVDPVIRERGLAYPWGDLLPALQAADLLLINLECALTSCTERWRNGAGKAFYFRADPSAVESLTLAGVDFASLANNHAGDFGTAGLLETLSVLDRAGIAHAGAGRDAQEARAPARLRAGGWRIGVVACADYPPDWAAGPDRPGINYVPISLARRDFAAVKRALAEARQQADLVIFSIHWGPNMRVRPTAPFREFARAVVESGADLFWGHSAHLVQGLEVWQDRLILYDTGDFVDDYAVDDLLRNDLSALFLVRVRPPAIEAVELLPVQIRRMRVTLADGPDRAWLVERLTTLCAEMGTGLLAGPDGRLSVALPARRA